MSDEVDRPPARRPTALSSASSERPDGWDYRDLVIEQLSDELAEMTERAVLAEADREVRRVMTQEALGQVVRMTAQLDEARIEILRLRRGKRRAHARPDRHAA
jgi:hypothetical protein